MNDNEKIAKVVQEITEKCDHLAVFPSGDAACSVCIVSALAPLIAQARDEAYEEAAKMCEAIGVVCLQGQKNHHDHDAQEIRMLKSALSAPGGTK